MNKIRPAIKSQHYAASASSPFPRAPGIAAAATWRYIDLDADSRTGGGRNRPAT